MKKVLILAAIVLMAPGTAAGSPQVHLTKTSVLSNHPPFFFPQSERGASIGEEMKIVLTADDPDGDTVTFSASGLPSGAVLNSNTFSWTPDSEGVYTVTFTVDDGQGNTISRDVTITVQNGGWYFVNKPDYYSTLYSVYFVDSTTGWTHGYYGSLLKTTDGGLTWIQQETGLSSTIYDLFFLDANTGWATATGGEIIKTTDGGETWNTLTSGVSVNLFGISFADTDTGYAAGYDGTVIKTVDGGTTWSSLSSGTTEYIEEIACTDANTAIVVGHNGTILKTTDGGTTWADKNPGFTDRFNDIYFLDSNTGWIAGGTGLVLKTTDGGDNWSQLTAPSSQPFYSIYFLDSNTGWVAGNSGELYKTADGGSTWSSIASQMISLYGVHYVNADTGWVCGMDGTLLKTIDGGTNWHSMNSGPSYRLINSHFVDENTGWSIGYFGGVIKTTDGGNSWIDQSGATTSTLRSCYFIDADTGWVAGRSGTIIYTEDGGSNWTTQTTNVTTYIYSIEFLDSDKGFAVGSGGVVLSTSDGGANWSNDALAGASTLRDVYFPDNNTGFIVGNSGKVYRTADGGTNWTDISPGITDNLYAVHFVDRNTGWAGGYNGILFKTDDAGNTWTEQNSNVTRSLYEIYMISALEGWIINTGNDVLYTNDGGETWHVTEDINEVETHSIEFINPTTGWVAANGSQILKYSAPRIDVAIADTVSYLSDTVRIPVTAGTSLTGTYVTSYTFSVQFNPDTLDFLDVDVSGAGGATGTSITAFANADSNIVKVAGAGVDDLTGTGSLADLLFTVKQVVPHNSQVFVSMSGFQFNEGNPVAVASDGSVTIKYRFGDADGDQSITESDAVTALQHVVSIAELTDFEQAEADVTGNGAVTAYDASNILMYLVGVISEFPAAASSASKQALYVSDYGIRSSDSEDMVDIIVEVNQAEGLYALEGSLEYDPVLFDFAGFKSNSGFVQTSDSDGMLDFALAGSEELTGDALTLRFRKTGPAASADMISIKKLMLNETEADGNMLAIEAEALPETYILRQNYPNPFNPSTTISFALPEAGFVKLAVYSTNGQLVRQLVAKQTSAGRHSIEWDGTNESGIKVSSGMYIYRIEAESFTASRKMILIK